MTDTRRQYRVSPISTDDLSIAIVVSRHRCVPGRIVDVSAGGIGLLFDPQSDVVRRVGQTLWLRISSNYLSEPLTASAVILRRTEVEEGRLYGLEFFDSLGLLSDLPPEFAGLFNQRREHRIEPDPEHPIEVKVEGIDDLVFEVKAFLRDLSTEGLSFRAPPLAECVLSKTKVADVSFRLEEGSEELTFCGRIRHRDLVGDCICYGVCFLPELTDNFQVKRAKLETYVTERRQEALDLLAKQNS